MAEYDQQRFSPPDAVTESRSVERKTKGDKTVADRRKIKNVDAFVSRCKSILCLIVFITRVLFQTRAEMFYEECMDNAGIKNYPPLKGNIKDIKTAVLWKKKDSTFEPDFCAQKLDSNPWIVQPFQRYEEIRVEDLVKKHKN